MIYCIRTDFKGIEAFETEEERDAWATIYRTKKISFVKFNATKEAKHGNRR